MQKPETLSWHDIHTHEMASKVNGHTQEHSRAWRQGDPRQRVSKPQGNIRKVLRVGIKNSDQHACPDSGSEKNIMSEAFALKQKFRIRNRPKDMRQFELGSGKKVCSTRRVSVPVVLHGTPHSWRKRWFYVLPNCPVHLVLEGSRDPHQEPTSP
jgi:hypothetical protein